MRVLTRLAPVVMLALSACANQAAQVQIGIAGINQALAAYEIDKGLAQVAEAADPRLAPALGAAIAAADPVAAKLQAAVSGAQLDVATVQALIAQLGAQSLALKTTAAPLIKAIPAG